MGQLTRVGGQGEFLRSLFKKAAPPPAAMPAGPAGGTIPAGGAAAPAPAAVPVASAAPQAPAAQASQFAAPAAQMAAVAAQAGMGFVTAKAFEEFLAAQFERHSPFGQQGLAGKPR
jgi:hypothetical protein